MTFRRLLARLPAPAGIALCWTLASCGRSGDAPASAGGPDSTEEADRAAETGGAAADALMARLGGQLQGALQSAGPVAAIQVCQQAAMPLTADAASGFEGVELRRVTTRPRNAANEPDERDRAVLERMEGAAAAGTTPADAIEWLEKTARFYRPVFVQEVCLACHGDPARFAPELSAALADLYPQDQATGYALGDFRGAIRVDIAR